MHDKRKFVYVLGFNKLLKIEHEQKETKIFCKYKKSTCFCYFFVSCLVFDIIFFLCLLFLYLIIIVYNNI